MSVLNKRYDYGLDLYLLSIDEGITGYRDDSLEVSCSRCVQSKLTLDGEAESGGIRSSAQNSVIQRVIRMDDGPYCRTSREEEQLCVNDDEEYSSSQAHSAVSSEDKR